MKVEENEEKINEGVKQRMKDLHSKGQYDLSQSPDEYEKIIQKLEAEVRNHISVQQQMKLYIESYQSKVEELEGLEDKYDKDKRRIQTMIKDVERLNKDNGELKRDKKALRKKTEDRQKEFNAKLENLNDKIKDLQGKLDIRSARETNQDSSLSKNDSKNKYFHHKNEMSVDIPESQKSLYYSFFDNSKKTNVVISK
eukprot:CAMPEP_0205806130 /NCGR_PEP_ID=MMETSP0205-20121125/9563_1 /ASSEMBLY_ACC=CAM_ASM_000278 /TAXON_ID=36767 /ORGANISM="Euplotes focardii, Strain TN1" /LENGTH=196 /DNA_ID=CAMNT_0053078459 /DNA_START=281 /DNA_END=871 /DNA_ORIENTATION=+